MPLPTIPSASEIKDRIVSDLDTKLNQTTPLLPKAFNRVLAGAIAGVILLLYQVIVWVYRQIFPDTADETSLKLLGSLVDVNILSAEFAVLTAEVPGTESYTVSEGITFRGTNNMVYKVTTGGVVSSGVATVTLTAQESGEAGNLADGSILDIISPNPSLTGTATITGTTTSGDDEEDLDSYRSRVTSAYKKRKTGGSPVDYEAWALETPNVDWASPIDDSDLPGTPIVYVKVDNQTDGIPTQSQLDEVLEYLLVNPDTGLRDRHPIGPYPEPTAISREEFDIEVFIQDGTTSIEDDITEAVTDYVENREPYNIAVSLTRTDTISRGGISDTANDIANPQGATVISVNLTEVSTSQEIPSYQLFGGVFGKVRTITYTVVS